MTPVVVGCRCGGDRSPVRLGLAGWGASIGAPQARPIEAFPRPWKEGMFASQVTLPGELAGPPPT